MIVIFIIYWPVKSQRMQHLTDSTFAVPSSPERETQKAEKNDAETKVETKEREKHTVYAVQANTKTYQDNDPSMWKHIDHKKSFRNAKPK